MECILFIKKNLNTIINNLIKNHYILLFVKIIINIHISTKNLHKKKL